MGRNPIVGATRAKIKKTPSSAAAASQEPTAETSGKPVATKLLTRKPPDSIEAYFDPAKSCFWSVNGKGQWQKFNTEDMACMLRNRGYMSRPPEGHSCSEVDMFLHSVRFHRSIDWSGELAGWKTGIHEIAGMEVLITRGNKPIVPRRGPFPLLSRFLGTLLSKEQKPYFLGWLKGSIQALREGFPFRPGQLVALAGSVDCGKSFLQALVTNILGGRQGDPTNFLLGTTDFTADFFRAEHLFVEDKALKDFSHSKRRAFAANLKGLIVNQDQKIHPKGKEASLLPVGTRITLSCNDAPEALAILPALDRDVADKVIYLLCEKGELPMRKDRTITRADQFRMFVNELPAFCYWLDRWQIPESILDPGNRFTVGSFHHKEIVARLQNLSNEERLLYLLEVLPLSWDVNFCFAGTPSEIEQWMREKDDARQLDRIVTYNGSVGLMLGKISAYEHERILREHTEGRESAPRIKAISPKGRKPCYLIDRNNF